MNAPLRISARVAIAVSMVGWACSGAWAANPSPNPKASALPEPVPSASAPKTASDAESVQPALDRALKVRDPFKQPNFSSKKSATELESIPVENLVLLGVMTGPLKTKAMVSAPGGKTFFITEGTKIGTRKGVVKRIDSSEVVVRERVVNYLGAEEPVDAKIIAQVHSNEVIEGEVSRLQNQAATDTFSVGSAWLKPDAFSGNAAGKAPAAAVPAPAAPVPAVSLPALSSGGATGSK